ncbi:MAG: SDR family oxidoreductase [Pirellulales bacterium]|nr:SDR family oxidoreductase [Pirellulales bacterium]
MANNRPWALVTGASSGLGVEFARLLVTEGYNIILSARRRERLLQLCGELQQRGPCEVRVIPADLAYEGGSRQLCGAVDALQLPVELLINNAGFGVFGPFLQQSAQQIAEMIAVNVTSATQLARHFAEGMAQRGSGGILQVCSYAGVQPIPRYSVYSACKAYGIALTQGLRYEFRKQGVRASALAPGFMDTEFHEVAQHAKTRWMRMLTLDAKLVARAGLKGLAHNQLLITPGWAYTLNNFAARLLPRSWGAAISARVVKNS